MVHDDYKELIPAHALSALEAADERALNEHLAECAECRRDLAEWEATAASLALSAKPMEPSPQVREKLLTQVRAEKSGSDSSASNVVPFSRPPRTLWNTLGSFGSIAAVVLFAGLIVSVVVLWQQNRALRHENDFFQTLNAPGARVAQLSGSGDVAPLASAKLAYDKVGRTLMVVENLPRPPAGKEYQLWYFVDNKPLPGKTFATDRDGKATLKDQMPPADIAQVRFAITLEPAGGVSSPTGAIYLFDER